MKVRNSGPVQQTDPAPGVRLLTLSLPKLRNAMTAELTEAWTNAIEDIKKWVEKQEKTKVKAGAEE